MSLEIPLALQAKASPARSRGQQLADAIQDSLNQAGYSAGHYLGTKAELRAQLNVPASSLDAALRILADRGVVTIKSGIGGGVLIAPASVDGVLQHGAQWRLRDKESLGQDQANEVIALLNSLYPVVVAQAAAVHDESDDARLRRACRDIEGCGEDLSAYSRAHDTLHRTLIDAAHMPVWSATILPVLDAFRGGVEAPLPPPGSSAGDYIAERARVHSAIVEGVLASDHLRAWAALREHGNDSRDFDIMPGGTTTGYRLFLTRWNELASPELGLA